MQLLIGFAIFEIDATSEDMSTHRNKTHSYRTYFEHSNMSSHKQLCALYKIQYMSIQLRTYKHTYNSRVRLTYKQSNRHTNTLTENKAANQNSNLGSNNNKCRNEKKQTPQADRHTN